MTNKERQQEKANQEEKLNRAFRIVFNEGECSKAALDPARKLVKGWLDAEEKGVSFVPDTQGHYCPVRAAINDGGRKLVNQIKKKFNSKAKTGEVDKIKTLRSNTT